jgi:hypothetical protein
MGNHRNYSVPLFKKEGLGEILLDKSPSIPLFKGGGEYLQIICFCLLKMLGNEQALQQ